MKKVGDKILLDTSIIIEIFSGNDLIADKVSQYANLYINTIILGELYVGVHRVSNPIKTSKQIEELLELCEVIVIDKTTSEFFGEIQASLYKKGKPLPTNDIWIASSAKQHNLEILTKDKHFSEIEGLTATIL